MTKSNKKKYDMSKSKSLEREIFLVSTALKFIGLCIFILLILAGLYIYTLHYGQDASGILHVINVLIGVIIGGIIAQVTAQIMMFGRQ